MRAAGLPPILQDTIPQKARDPEVPATHRFLLVDGDAASAAALSEQLGRVGDASVALAGTAEAALALAAGEHDLVLVSLPLGDAAAGPLLTGLRARIGTGVLLVLAAAEIEAAAADEVLLRPVKLAHLQARIEALIMRRVGIGIGPYRFHAHEKLLVDPADRRQIRLTEKEVAILDRLAQAEARTATRELLLNEVWGYRSGVTTHTLETHVYRLRQKIESDPANAVILVSEPGGYRLADGEAMGETAMGERKA